MNLIEFNKSSDPKVDLFDCCGSQAWAEELVTCFPFGTELELVEKATQVWYNHCVEADWLEAFTHHPKIGDLSSLKKKFAGKEQESVAYAPEDTLLGLAKANEDYEAKFGFIFIVCATGKSAGEMLQLITDRLENDRENELAIAMGEQHKITIIRLKKLLYSSDWSFLKNSHITTHVLDTSIGKTGQNICIKLKNTNGTIIAQGRTNNDGRIPDLLPPGLHLPFGHYSMWFDIEGYALQQRFSCFYPEVEICFKVFDKSHYHIPLLINPFGYSTYRGS